MLVPSMSLEEIRKEITKDLLIVYRKALYVRKALFKANSPIKNKRVVKVLEYLSKNKNTWLVKLDLDKKGCRLNFLIYYYNNTGLAAIEVFPEKEMRMYFTTHFFKRYNERLQLNCQTPKQLLHEFITNHHGYMVTKVEELAPGIHKIFAATEKGVVLGTQLDDKKFIKMNTFITNDMLRGNQIETEAQIRGMLNKYLESIHRLD